MIIRYLPWAVAALYLAFLFPSPEFPPYNADDGSWFVTMGWNMAQFGRYTTDTFPFAEYGHHATWPPLFASLLAGVIAVVGLNWLVLKLLMVLIGLGALALLHRLWRDDALGIWTVLLTALSPVIFLYSHHTMTEMPYLAAVVATLLALSRAQDSRTAFLAGLLAVLAFLTRGYAVIFLLAGPLYFMLRPWPMRQRLFASLAFVLPLLVSVIAWKGYTGHVIASLPLDVISQRFGSGADLLQGLLRSPMEYAQRLYWFELRYPAHLMLPLLPLDWVLRDDLAVALSLPLLALIGYGWLILFLRRRGAVECWLPLALAFLLVPRSGAVRYLIPFLPFLFYYLLHGLREVGQRLPRLETATRVAPFALLLVIGVALALHLAEPERLRFVTPDSKDYRDIALWSGANLPADTVVLAPAAHRFIAASGLATWPIDLQPEPPESIIRGNRPIYLLCVPERPAAKCAELSSPTLSRGKLALYRMPP